jgi:hypothetical protein
MLQKNGCANSLLYYKIVAINWVSTFKTMWIAIIANKGVNDNSPHAVYKTRIGVHFYAEFNLKKHILFLMNEFA